MNTIVQDGETELSYTCAGELKQPQFQGMPQYYSAEVTFCVQHIPTKSCVQYYVPVSASVETDEKKEEVGISFCNHSHSAASCNQTKLLFQYKSHLLRDNMVHVKVKTQDVECLEFQQYREVRITLKELAEEGAGAYTVPSAEDAYVNAFQDADVASNTTSGTGGSSQKVSPDSSAGEEDYDA